MRTIGWMIAAAASVSCAASARVSPGPAVTAGAPPQAIAGAPPQAIAGAPPQAIAGAPPQAIANASVEPTPPNRGCGAPIPTREIVAASELGFWAKVFASARGLEVFWDAHAALGDPKFWLAHRPFSRAAEALGPQHTVLSQYVRQIAVDDAGTFAVTYSVNFESHVAILGQQVIDVALPAREIGYGTIAIGWDPQHAHWVLVGEEPSVLPDRSGYTNRLFTGRLDRRGRWVEHISYLSAPSINASLSDWSTPLIWAGGRMAVVWAGSVGRERALYVTELEPGRATAQVVTRGSQVLFRSVLAWTKTGYVVAGAAYPERLRDSRVFVTTLRNGVAAPLRFVSRPGFYAGEAVIASDGARVALAWDEQDQPQAATPTTSVRAALVDEQGGVSVVYATETPPGSVDSTQALAWDGCHFTLLHVHGNNPSAIMLVQLGARSAELAR